MASHMCNPLVLFFLSLRSFDSFDLDIASLHAWLHSNARIDTKCHHITYSRPETRNLI